MSERIDEIESRLREIGEQAQTSAPEAQSPAAAAEEAPKLRPPGPTQDSEPAPEPEAEDEEPAPQAQH